MKRTQSLEAYTQSEHAETRLQHRWLVVISHQEARIFRSEAHGTVPEVIRPAPKDEANREKHSLNFFSRGLDKPDPSRFFGQLAGALSGAREFLVFGSGTGVASGMDQFVAWLKAHHPDLARRISGTLVVDARHNTDNELLAKARDQSAARPSPDEAARAHTPEA